MKKIIMLLSAILSAMAYPPETQKATQPQNSPPSLSKYQWMDPETLKDYFQARRATELRNSGERARSSYGNIPSEYVSNSSRK